MQKAALAIAVAAILFSAYGIFELKQTKDKVSELELKLTELVSRSQPQPEPSPFDNMNTDPMAPPVNPMESQPTTEVKFDRLSYDFGTINEGDKVKTKFKFTNTGKNPLVINSAVGSCGCTVPNWPKAPLAPGESALMDVEFDSKDKPGQQMKTVTVMANTNPPKIELTIKATVKPAQ